MNQLSSQIAPNYVTCSCQYCGGNIEFDSNQLDATENPTVSCPHCQLHTAIVVPVQRMPNVKLYDNLPPAIDVMHEDEVPNPVEQCNPEVQFKLGMIYYCGVKRPRDFAKAVKLWRESAEQGYSDAQFGLGCAYLDGTGIPRDYREALRWFRSSAEQGNTYAQFNLGIIYWNGEGLQKDSVEAVNWFRKAAEQGHVEAQCLLGKVYANGIGVPKDKAETLKWLRKAAEQGNSDAQTGLGVAYQDDDTFPELKNLVEAYKWAVLASPTGGSLTKRLLETLTCQMTQSQIEEGQRLASIEALKIKNNTSNVSQTAELNQQRKAIRAAINRDRDTKESTQQSRQTRMAISSQVRREVWRRDGGACVKCGSRCNLEYDHIIPVSKGGGNTARNIELLCEACNRSKSASIQ
jgi:5-methylcytosine-specific restriction endonuclease McrA